MVTNFLFFITFIVPQIYTPDSSVRFAAADLATIPESERKYIRYLSLYNIPKEKRREYGAAISFMVNSLSRRKRIFIPVFVGNSDETVVRLQIDRYEWNPEAWEELAAKGSGVRPFSEPYFHTSKAVKHATPVKKTKVIETEEWVPIPGRFYNGFPVKEKKVITKTVDIDGVEISGGGSYQAAPWVSKEDITYLEKWTHSAAPIFRADWFLVNVSVPPAYYNFLGVGKKLKDFQDLIFTDEALAKKARGQDSGTVITSIVARNNRILLRSPTFTKGYYWTTRDFLNSIDDEKEVLKNLIADKSDATEDIGTLPNGLQAYFLTNGRGDRVDFADPNVALDNEMPDRIVRPGRSCIICHAEGIRPIDDEVRAITKELQNKEQVRLLITDKEQLKRIEDLFSSDLDQQIQDDNNIYNRAIARVNGMKTKDNALLFKRIYIDYAETLLNFDLVAADVGMTTKTFRTYIPLSNDPKVLGLVKTPIRPIRRDQWEKSFQDFMLNVMQKNGAVFYADKIVIVEPVPVYIP